MNHAMDTIGYTPVPCMCSGIITSKLEEEESYEIKIYESPMGELNGPIYGTLMYSPGTDGNYKQGDQVKVMVTFTFGGAENKFIDVSTTSNNYIVGAFNERTMATRRVDHPIAEDSPDVIRFLNLRSYAGVVATDNGQCLMTSGGAIHSLLKPFGFGMYENLNYQAAQNFQRIVSHNPPAYFAREHFGMYAGEDVIDKSVRLRDEDFPVIYRRFVTQTRSPDNWVSTCEGAYAPWVGANINETTVDKNKDVLFTKIVNFKDSRTTVEIGKPGDEFINIRVDDVKLNESAVPVSPGATPALVGNRFKLTVSDKGNLELRAASQGTPSSNINSFHLKIDESGVTLNSKGRIVLSHGDNDESNNSIVLDPEKGIDITALNGLRINGQEAVLKSFVDFLNKYQAQWCQVTAIGAPAPIHPAILPEFNAGVQKFGANDGFTSKGKSVPASGIIKDTDKFETV